MGAVSWCRTSRAGPETAGGRARSSVVAFRDFDVLDFMAGIGEYLPRVPRRGGIGRIVAAGEDGF